MKKTAKLCDICETELGKHGSERICIDSFFDGYRNEKEYVDVDLCEKHKREINTIASRVSLMGLTEKEPFYKAFLLNRGAVYLKRLFREHST